MLATACSATSITAASSLAVEGPAGVSCASLGSTDGASRAPALDQLPITFDELLELDHTRLLGAHRRLGPARLLERPQLLPTLRGLGRRLLQVFGLLPQELLETRGSGSGRAELLVLPEDGFLGVAQLGVHLLELAAQGDELRLHRPALSDRSLQIRGQRLAELLRGLELFLEPRQPALRLGELGGEAFGALLRRTRVLRGPVERGVSLGERRPNARRAVSEEPALQVGHGWSPLRSAVACVVRGLCARPRGGSNISHRFWLRPRRHGPRPIRVGRAFVGAGSEQERISRRVVRRPAGVLDQPGVVRGGRSIRRPVPAPLRWGVPGSCELQLRRGDPVDPVRHPVPRARRG